MWRKHDDPPETSLGCWSKDVIVLTNFDDVFKIAYYGDKESGVWQRPRRFNKGEKVEWWIDAPYTKGD